MEVYGDEYGNMRRCLEVCGHHLPWIKYTKVSGNIRKLSDSRGINGVVWRSPEHTAYKAISALIYKNSRINDYQDMVL